MAAAPEFVPAWEGARMPGNGNGRKLIHRGSHREAVDPGENRGSADPVELDRRSLRFRDPELERAFRRDYFHHNLGNVRFALLGGVVLWLAWGFVIRRFLPISERPFDLVMRYGVFIPLLGAAFALSFTRVFERIWEWAIGGVVLITLLLYVFYASQIIVMPADFGYVGVILITVFAYALIRLPFRFVLVVTATGIAAYLSFAVSAAHILGVRTALAALYLLSFGALAAVAGYRLEASRRLLFLRERQLDRERDRSETLLLNILPRAIVDRLKRRRDGGHLAEALDDVSVLFADAVRFTEQAAKVSAQELVESLDELFRRFDGLADRQGLEKIKTVGDAYMAVAGAPVPMRDHAAAAAEMALAILDEVRGLRWPSGDPVTFRIGVASGPAVAGVLGHRKFAYDLWGDTVNLASRLESQAPPGGVLVSESMAEHLEGRYELGPSRLVELKGKGPTPARSLIGRRSSVEALG
jgi:class 3 adenylate cyclase